MCLAYISVVSVMTMACLVIMIEQTHDCDEQTDRQTYM